MLMTTWRVVDGGCWASGIGCHCLWVVVGCWCKLGGDMWSWWLNAIVCLCWTVPFHLCGWMFMGGVDVVCHYDIMNSGYWI